MKTYDEIVGFDYTNTLEWEDFAKKHILPLDRSISKLIGLREDLENRINDDTLPDLIKDDTTIRQILLGGINENGEYRQNSLAKLYKEMVGASIDPKEWVICCKQEGIDASRYVKCNFSDTVFLQFIRALKGYTDKLLPRVGIDGIGVTEGEIKEIFENPEKIADELKAIYTQIINISANHNYRTFLILNTRCIPRRYIEKAYPRLKSEFDKLAEFLGLEQKFVPEIEEEGVRGDYILWCHKEDGFADLVYGLNRTVWGYLEKEEYDSEIDKYTRVLAPIFEIVGEFPNLKREFFSNVTSSLKYDKPVSRDIKIKENFGSGYYDMFECKKCINELERDKINRPDHYWYDPRVYDLTYTIIGPIVEKVEHRLDYTKSWNNGHGTTSRPHEEKLTFQKFIDNISLLLFLKIIDLETKENRLLIIKRGLV